MENYYAAQSLPEAIKIANWLKLLNFSILLIFLGEVVLKMNDEYMNFQMLIK